jgi:hypothetical protein
MKTEYFILQKAWQLAELLSLLYLLILSNTTSLQAEDSLELSKILATLKEPLTLVLKGGNQQTGRVTEWDGESIRIEVSLGGGVAELSFSKDDIKQIIFPGNEFLEILYEWKQDPAQTENAMPLYRAYYQQRGPYFTLMSESELSLFVSYAEYALEKNKPLRALAMINAVSPHIHEAAVLDRLEEGLLLGFFQGGMRKEAEAKASDWIKKADPSGPSALGWRLLAQSKYENEDYEEAFWTALFPVAFSNQMPKAHLDVCYALAILSAGELHLKEEPERLAKEMRDRGFTWPDYIEILNDKAPEAFTIGAGPKLPSKTEVELSLEEAPIQNSSPLDPIEELPTRINF